MTMYIANHQKKKNIFQKREKELLHAIKHGFSEKKLNKSAEKLREAKLNVFKSEFSKNSILPASSYVSGKEAKEWKEISVDVLIEQYRIKTNLIG